MAAPIRCDELITRLRMNLGEPTEGTFGTTFYDGIREDVNELRFILNLAQEHFTWLCYSANQSLIQETVYFPVLSGVTRYTLSELFLAPVSLFHRTYNQEYPVEEANLDDIRARVRSNLSNYHFENFEITERAPLIAAQGVVGTSHETRITDADLDAVRVDDTAYNITDGSQGTIEAVNIPDGYVTVDGLRNGRSNRWQRGDVYQIDQREATRDAMDLFPKVTKSDTGKGHSGMASNWVVDADAVVYSIYAYISAIPSNFEEDERVILELVEDDNTVVGKGAREGLNSGKNEFEFLERVQIREDSIYSVRAYRAENNLSLDVDSIEVVVRTDPESLVLKQVRYPKPMELDSDLCEVPSWAIKGMLSYAHILAEKKASGNPIDDPGLKNDLKEDMKDAKSFMYKRGERGPHHILGGTRAEGFPFPSNYSRWLVDLGDFL